MGSRRLCISRAGSEQHLIGPLRGHPVKELGQEVNKVAQHRVVGNCNARATNPESSVQVLNNAFSDPLRGHLAEELGQDVDDAALISIDSRGVDVRVRQGARVRPLSLWHPI
jgi:hypothetical protein